MTKAELEVKIEALQKLLSEKVTEQTTYQNQIKLLEKQLKDINKPKLTPLQFDELRDAIETGIESFDFDDQDNYGMDFHIDYDNRIAVESMSFHNAEELLRVVYNEACELFAEADEDNNQLNQD